MLDFIQLGLNIKHKIKIYISSTHKKLEGKYSLESTDPRKSEIRAHLHP